MSILKLVVSVLEFILLFCNHKHITFYNNMRKINNIFNKNRRFIFLISGRCFGINKLPGNLNFAKDVKVSTIYTI